jgi:hypothetical protein
MVRCSWKRASIAGPVVRVHVPEQEVRASVVVWAEPVPLAKARRPGPASVVYLMFEGEGGHSLVVGVDDRQVASYTGGLAAGWPLLDLLGVRRKVPQGRTAPIDVGCRQQPAVTTSSAAGPAPQV